VRAAVEKYATIGLCGGCGGCLFAAILHGNPVLFPILLGGVIGTLTGATYGLLRARIAR
jgi:hypothetical protein